MSMCQCTNTHPKIHYQTYNVACRCYVFANIMTTVSVSEVLTVMVGSYFLGKQEVLSSYPLLCDSDNRCHLLISPMIDKILDNSFHKLYLFNNFRKICCSYLLRIGNVSSLSFTLGIYVKIKWCPYIKKEQNKVLAHVGFESKLLGELKSSVTTA